MRARGTIAASRRRNGTPPVGEQIATFTIDGSGDGADTVVVFGHSFPEDAIPVGTPVLMRRADNNAELRTQTHVLTTWPDGSVKTAAFAVEAPALADTTTLGLKVIRDDVHSSPGSNLTWSGVLSGRSISIKTWAPGNTTTPLWTYDVAAALTSSTDDWMSGPLALQRRVFVAELPSTATNAPGGGAGPTSVSLTVDVTATKDGMILVDWCFANDRVNKIGGGPARFGYTVEIDGTMVFDQRPSTGAGRDLLMYNWWWRRRAKKGATVYNFYSTFRPLFRPDYQVLVNSKYLLTYDRDTWPSGLNLSWLGNTITAAATSSTDPYWPASLVRENGAAGGRPEIGYKTLEQALWAVNPMPGSRTAELVAHINAECFGVAGVYFRDYENNRPVLADEWPRFTAENFTDAANSNRLLGESLCAGQNMTNNATDHIVAKEQQHRGAHYGLTALISGRRLCYDALAFRSAECCIYTFRWNGTDLDTVVAESHRSLTPNFTTGVNWVPPPHEMAARGQAWQMRDIVEAAYLLPDTYPRRDFYNKTVEAWFARYVGAQAAIDARMQGYFGLTITGKGSWRVTGFMYSFCFYAVAAAKRMGVVSESLINTVLDRMTDFRAGGALQSESLNRLMRLGQNVDWAPANQPPPFPATTWAQVATESDAPSAAWELSAEIDWQRNAVAGTMMCAAYAGSDEKKGIGRDALVRMWSERQIAPDLPVTAKDWPFSANPQTNHVCPETFGFRWDIAPTLVTPAPMNVVTSAPEGTFIGLVEWRGAIPRCTVASLTNHDAFEIVSQPAGNPFTISRGGVVRRSGTGTLTETTYTMQVRCRSIQGDAPRGDTEITRWSNTVTVTINGTAAPLSAPVNTVLPTITGTATQGQTLTATTGTWTGNPVPTYAYQWQRGTTNIPGATAGTYTLVAGDVGNTIRVVVTATNSQGSASATSASTSAVVGPPAAPVNTAIPTISGTAQEGQVLTASPGTWTGSPSPTFTYQWQRGTTNISGATASTYTAVTADVGSTLRVVVTATNSEGSANATSANTATVTAAPASDTIWTAPSATFEEVWSVNRRLRSAYSGNLFRAIRLSDNAEQNIGFNSGTGLLDTSALTTFASGGEVRIMRIYGQKNGQDIVFANPVNRPQICDSSGNLILVPGGTKVGIRGAAVDVFGSGAVTLPASSIYAIFGVGSRTAGTQEANFMEINTTGGNADRLRIGVSETTQIFAERTATAGAEYAFTSTNGPANGTLCAYAAWLDADNGDLHCRWNNGASRNTTNLSVSTARLGSRNTPANMEARIDPWFAGSAESIQGEWAVCRGISTSDLDAILTEQYAFYDA